jgi:TnpA family transposase
MRATRRSILASKKAWWGYTLVANHIPVNARIIGAHEHESRFVFDLLFNNTTGIQPNVHSTDTHGTNEVNLVLLHMFNYQFAPRYTAIQEKVRTSLYGFHHPSQYGDLILKPIRKIQTELIVEEWDNLQRIFVSLARKTTTQSIIAGKLSAYARKNKTRQALMTPGGVYGDPSAANWRRYSKIRYIFACERAATPDHAAAPCPSLVARAQRATTLMV